MASEGVSGEDRVAVIVLALIVIVSIFALVMLFTNGKGAEGRYVTWDTFRKAPGGAYGGTSWEEHTIRTYYPTRSSEHAMNASSATRPPLSKAYYR